MTHTTEDFIRHRRTRTIASGDRDWWITSGDSIFLPTTSTNSIPSSTSRVPSILSTVIPSTSNISALPAKISGSDPDVILSTPSTGGQSLTTFTSDFPITITQSSTTFTSYSQIFVTTNVPSSITPGTAGFSSTSPTGQVEARVQPVCIGDGLDASSDGMIATIILPSAVGLVIWLIFAVARPHFRQVYGLREWFVQQDLRPQPLGTSLWAFLFPHVPLVPSVPEDVSDAGRSPADDAELFPSDEQMSQRALWISLLIVLGWTILGLAGALPLYIISTPCLAALPSPAVHGGVYSTLQDLSLLRLLQFMDDRKSFNTTNLLYVRSVSDGNFVDPNIHVRIDVLTALVIVVALLPALWKIIKEFNRMVAYRRRWLETRCEGKDMGWLSARQAPGFVGWGERRLKDFILKNGLSSSLDSNGNSNGRRNGNRDNVNRVRRPRNERDPLTHGDEPNLQVDIQSLFSIGDTENLALLIDERDEILENLEIAETKYISSFRITTPDPSIADFMPPPPVDPDRPIISRPRPLGNGTRRSRRRRALNPAFAASSLAPTSFVAPSQYYKLRGLRGVSGGGRFADLPNDAEQPSFGDSIHSRVVGSRFQEVNRNSVAYGRLPMGSHVKVEKSGELGPGYLDEPILDPQQYGPNVTVSSWIDPEEFGDQNVDSVIEEENEDWVNLEQDLSIDYYGDPNMNPTAGPSRRPQKKELSSFSGRHESFPLRARIDGNGDVQEHDLPPPHLRLQPHQPFVRPMSGINHEDLGVVYADIRLWRSRLKAINAAIVEAQEECYHDISDGARIKGWLLIGRGLRFVPGIKLIEGRAKEDIRWDVLQNERSRLDSVVLWTIVAIVTILLAAGLTAASGLALATAPDFAHYLSFLQPIANHNSLTSGLASTLASAVAAVLFITLAVAIIHWAANIRGSVSISAGQLLAFKATFFILTVVAALWLITIGALLFGIQAFSTNTNQPQTVANGSIYISTLALAIIISLAIIYPGLLLLQPFRVWSVIRAERRAVTPRQRFRAVYPRTYNPSLATGACVLAIVFAATFSLIFPLIGPAVVVLLFLTLVAHRYLVGYVYARTHSQTGGLLQIWLLQRFGTICAFQPILLGLIFLSRQIWIEGGILVGAGVIVILSVEVYASWKTKLPGRKSLSVITQDSLDIFRRSAKANTPRNVDEESTSLVSSARGTRIRGSMASVLEMMSITLAVMPSSSMHRGPVPLQTETLDDLTATERAARTHPDAPPHLPPLAFTDHAEDMAGILYAPELIAPPPIIWLPNDSAGVARSEATDLQKYHGLQATLDVRAKEDVLPKRSSSSR